MCGTYVCVICKTPYESCWGDFEEDVGKCWNNDWLLGSGDRMKERSAAYKASQYRKLCCEFCKVIAVEEVKEPISIERQAVIREVSLGNRKAYEANPIKTTCDCAPRRNVHVCKWQKEGVYDKTRRMVFCSLIEF